MIYDVVIVGAGASGLFAAANIKSNNPDFRGLILNKAERPGLKLLMSGGGQCNLTHGGDMRDFIPCYGSNGKKIRSLLYSFGNDSLKLWFQERGLRLTKRPDGKIFPESMRAKDVLDLLVKEAENGNFVLKNGIAVTDIAPGADSGDNRIFTITAENGSSWQAHKVIIAAGGLSYPVTGSDGSIYPVLAKLGHSIVSQRPSLVPLQVEGYPYGELSGYAVRDAEVYIYSGSQRPKKAPCIKDDVLLTTDSFSGPAVLNISRYALAGSTMEINWYPEKSSEAVYDDLINMKAGNRRQIANVLADYFKPQLSEAFAHAVIKCAGADPACRMADVSSAVLRTVIRFITSDVFTISGTSGYSRAMCTAGGIDLSEVDLKSMESRLQPGLYLTGEVLDVDGDTGGYNLHFAFASAAAAAGSINETL